MPWPCSDLEANGDCSERRARVPRSPITRALLLSSDLSHQLRVWSPSRSRCPLLPREEICDGLCRGNDSPWLDCDQAHSHLPRAGKALEGCQRSTGPDRSAALLDTDLFLLPTKGRLVPLTGLPFHGPWLWAEPTTASCLTAPSALCLAEGGGLPLSADVTSPRARTAPTCPKPPVPPLPGESVAYAGQATSGGKGGTRPGGDCGGPPAEVGKTQGPGTLGGGPATTGCSVLCSEGQSLSVTVPTLPESHMQALSKPRSCFWPNKWGSLHTLHAGPRSAPSRALRS